MWANIRILLLAVIVGIAATQITALQDIYNNLFDRFDDRPAVTVLFIGNSRTFYNDMPSMIPKMANSAHSSQKYQITIYALPGKSSEGLWKESALQDLLKQKWDYVVIQGGSNEQINDVNNHSFLTYGAEFVGAARQSGSKPVLLVAWKCADSYYPELATLGPYYYNMIQASYSSLASSTGAASVNVGQIWEKVQNTSPLPLTVDGNHPTVRGSYLVALMFYRFFSGDNLDHVTYLPSGVTADDAKLLKTAAQTW